MDHFNATIKDGKLVKTRRGLQVSRQKFNGLSFVNTSPHEDASGPRPSGATEASTPAQREIKFVDEGSESGRETPGAHRKDAERQDFLGTAQGTKRRRRATRRGKSPAASTPGTPSRSSPLPPGERSFQFEYSAASPDMLQLDPRLNPGPSSAGATPELDSPLSGDDWALFERYFNDIPRGMYPYEDLLTYNPARGPDFYSMVTGDAAALRCVLMCGSIAEAATSQAEPKDLAYHISKICAILNQKLNQSYAADAVTLHCIATLAWVGCYVGRLDHWHLHMRGLKKMLDLNGGMTGLPPWLLAEMYKADLRGATALASSPYLPFTRQYSSGSNVLPSHLRDRNRDRDGDRDQTATTISALLGPLHIDPQVVASLSSLANLTSAIRLTRQSANTATFDPHVFSEEWQALTHALLTQPAVLRSDTTNPYSTRARHTASPTDTGPTSPTESSYTSNHRLLPSLPILPAPTGPNPATNPLEPALRIAALLLLKQLLPDSPRNLGGYAVLLSLLRHHLHELVHRNGHGEHPPIPNAPGQPAAGLPLPAGTGPELEPEPEPEPEREPPGSAPGDTAHLNKATVFLALVGDTVSRVADRSEGRAAAGECYPRGIYRECLAAVAGLADAAGVDDALGDGAMSFAGLFELGMVFRGVGSTDEGEGEEWDGWGALRRIVGGEL